MITSKKNLLGLDVEAMSTWFQSIGEKPFRAKQLIRWIHKFQETDFAAMTDLSKSLREKLVDIAEIRPPKVKADQTAKDGTRKWLLDLGDNNAVEMVFIPSDNRGTLCISSQVGCKLNCPSCATGQNGFKRDMTSGEIIGQLWVANQRLGATPNGDRIIDNVVFMGMGEPLLNLDNTIAAIRIMMDDNAYGLSRRKVTVSTCGIIPGMDRLRIECPVALAISLHAPNDSLRNKLVPINKKYPLKDLMAACRRYLANTPKHHVTFEYILIDGVNDKLSDAAELIELVKDVSCKFNLIPFNPFPGSEYKRPRMEKVRNFADQLMKAGCVATIRKTRGEDISAACGQLAGEMGE